MRCSRPWRRALQGLDDECASSFEALHNNNGFFMRTQYPMSVWFVRVFSHGRGDQTWEEMMMKAIQETVSISRMLITPNHGRHLHPVNRPNDSRPRTR